MTNLTLLALSPTNLRETGKARSRRPLAEGGHPAYHRLHYLPLSAQRLPSVVSLCSHLTINRYLVRPSVSTGRQRLQGIDRKMIDGITPKLLSSLLSVYYMITFGPLTLQRHRASWHEDQDLTKRQAKLLFDDVEATRDRYIGEAVALMVQPSEVGQIELRRDDDGLIWVVWVTVGDPEGQALAVFTEPQTRIEGCHMVVEWHWSPVSQGVN